ncbi:MAG: KUP/HAK/KT family potassium transporter [Flavobacteriales bacterium]|nr:KUP/HAK/KT family potassium transporter [Flavobacteriales bacterium]MBP6696509.1 KUP/HAK/KT family potassium transporter [Flavobacteriales bacterium]
MPQTPKHNHPLTVAGLLVTLGIIYGDIGTSPLYVFKAIIGARAITEDLVFGGISCVVWTLTLQTTFKYIFLTLRADNRGEGGIFSLYALVRRYAKWIYLPTILGAATLMADGIITPPISVSSAIEGLGGVRAFEGVIAPGNNLTVGIVIGIISLLFFFQRFGTKVVGFAFGPIMLIWFCMLFVLGLVHVIAFPHVLQCLNPYYAYALLVEYPGGFWILGAVFLCTTGAEALYSDLGHCGRRNIQTSWIFVKTALVINYMGQGAWILTHGGTHLNGANPFYELMPPWFLVIGVVIATLAAIIASQALISGSFTLISEAIQLNFWPRVRVKYPTEMRGQIYIPSVNWILWLGCLAVMFIFRESGHMEAAYGFFIVIAMLMTTTLMFGYLHLVRRWTLWLVLPIMGVFLSVEGAYFIANAVKILQRPWFVLSVLSLVGVMFVWFRGRKITNRFLDFVRLSDYTQALRDLSDDKEIPKYATHLVYLTKADNPRNVEKQVMDSILARKVKRADIYWFVHVNYTDEPYTMEYRVKELIDDKVIRVDFDLGFRVQARINMLFRRVMEEMESEHELEFRNKYESIKKGDFHTDICYVLTERILSVENEFDFRKDAILDAYYALKHLALGDREAFGLDPNVTLIEQVPLVISAAPPVPLERVGKPKGTT